MYKIQTLNKIAKQGTDIFDKAKYEISDAPEAPDAILVRSAKMHDMQFGSQLLAIARAGAGTNNIPTARCAEEGIVVFNTPGANAEAVKELAIAAMLLSGRDVIGGIDWVKTIAGTPDVAAQVEAGKSAYVGGEIYGKTLGVIGLGAIGAKLVNDAVSLGMNVYGFDPYLSAEAAWKLTPNAIHTKDVAEIYKNCDFISIHVPYIDASKENSTHHYINKNTIAQMKKGVVIMNLSRAELVNDDDILAAIEAGHVSKYVTDFPNNTTAGAAGVLAIPHLGASTPESEEKCAYMAAVQTIDYIENGNIVNSVNMPRVTMPRAGAVRVCVIHRGAVDAVAITAAIGAEALAVVSAPARGVDVAYTMVDVADIADSAKATLEALDGVIKVRILK